MTKEPCKTCGFIHLSDDAVAIGRFRKDGPIGYLARLLSGAPLRKTREQADEDACRSRISVKKDGIKK